MLNEMNSYSIVYEALNCVVLRCHFYVQTDFIYINDTKIKS